MNGSIYLLLGTNLGDRKHNLLTANLMIEKSVGKILNLSSIYKTAAWGKVDQPEFYNQVIELETDLGPKELLYKILSIETDLGRKREEKWGARTIDIDILFYQDAIVKQSDLNIPHPGIAERRFTLVPLNEIAFSFVHPVLQKKIKALLDECVDPLPVEKLTI